MLLPGSQASIHINGFVQVARWVNGKRLVVVRDDTTFIDYTFISEDERLYRNRRITVEAYIKHSERNRVDVEPYYVELAEEI